MDRKSFHVGDHTEALRRWHAEVGAEALSTPHRPSPMWLFLNCICYDKLIIISNVFP